MSSQEPAARVLSLFDEESVALEDGRLRWIPVRRRLGIGAFGTNAFSGERAGDPVIEDHIESPGREELYVVLRGIAAFQVGEEALEVGAGGAVFVPRPEVKRGAVALEDGTVVLAVGGWRDRPYRSLPWEPIYLAQQSMRDGDWARAAETLEQEAGEHLDTAVVQFRLACCHARLGQHDRALTELLRAIEINPDMRQRAERDDSLAAVRDLAGWRDSRQ